MSDPGGSEGTQGMAPGGGAEVQYVSANGQVDLSLAVEGVAEGTACSFEIKKVSDDSVVTTIQGEVTNGVAVGTWLPELDPEAGERGIRIYYVTTVEDRTERSPELEVYLDYIDIESQDADGNPLPDATYELRVRGPGSPPEGTVRRGRTGSTGKIRETAVPPGEAVLEWVGPFALLEWVDDSGPTRTAKLERVNRVKFAWPSPEGEGGLRYWMDDGSELPLHERYHAHVQLVNFDATDASRVDHPERGSVLRLRVTAAPAERGLAGDEVHVKVVWAPAEELSKRSQPARTLVGGSTSLPWATGDGTQGLLTSLPADQGEVTFDVDLGRAGGDVCTIYIGCTTRCEDAKLVVTNRRTVGYQVTRRSHQSMPDITNGSVSAARYLDQLFVDFQQVGDDLVYSDLPPLGGTTPAYGGGLTVVPASWFEQSGTGDCVVIGAHNFSWFESKLRADVGRTGLNLVLADQMLNGVLASSGTMPHRQGILDSVWSGYDADDGTFVCDYEYFIRIPNSQGTRYQVFPRAFHDGGATLRAEWFVRNEPDLPEELRRKRGAIPPEWITIDRFRTETRTRFGAEESFDGRFGVWVAFPEDSIPGQVLTAGKNVGIVGDLYLAEMGVLGLSGGSQIVIKLSGVSDAVQNHALAHEVAHNMRQAAAHEDRVPDSYHVPPGLSFADHPFGYTGHEQLGPHCSAGLTDEQRAAPDYRDFDGACVMFGSVDDDGAAACTGFCEDCKEFGRAVACTDLHRDPSLAAIGEGGDGEEADDPPPVVEVALASDPRADFPRAGKLEVTAGGATSSASLVPGGAWSFARLTPEAGKTYKVALKLGDKSHTLLDGEDLEAYAQGSVGSTAVQLVVLARKAGAPPAGGGAPAFEALTVTEASLVAPGTIGAAVTLADAHGAGKGGDITTVAPGVYTLRVKAEGQDAPIELPLIVGPPEDVLFESPPQGCTVVRVRGGRPGAWGGTWFFVTVAPPTQRVLVAPSNHGNSSDLYTASNAANEVRDYYKKKGFAVDIIRTPRKKADGAGPPTLCDSWDELLKKLEGAASEPYARLITIGHGGYDGTIYGSWQSQVSVREETDLWWRFVDAVKKGMTPDGKLYFSSCHGGGSDSSEWKAQLDRDAASKKALADAKAKKAAAERARDAAKDQAEKDRQQAVADEQQGTIDSEESNLKWGALNYTRWAEEVARATGRVASGPMGYTSTGRLEGDAEARSLSHAKAALEGEGKARQALWLCEPGGAGASFVIAPSKNAAAKEATFRGQPIAYPGPLTRSGAPPPPSTEAPPPPSTAWVPPPQADIPAPVAAGN